MASILACARVRAPPRQCRCVPRQLARLYADEQRGLHHSAVALAKKKGKNAKNDAAFADEEDMFGFTEEDDLFGAKPEPSKQNPHRGSADRTTSAGATDSRATANGTASKGTMSPQMRIRRFDKLFQFASDRIGLQPVLAKAPEQVRNTIWQQLFKLATRREQMEAVVELFPKWRDSRRQFTPIMSEEFIQRCEELACPELALQVFSDHPKYGVDLTAAGARRLMHSLHVKQPLSDSVTLVALHNIYQLPPISRDLVSCSMFVSACFRAGTEQSLTVAHATLPALRKLLQDVDPVAMAYPTRRRTSVQDKEKAWLRWTLERIQKSLEKRNEPFDWLQVWRQRSGHVAVAQAA